MCTPLFDPKVDYIFKNLFGSEKHPNILISFLNACIRPKNSIVSVQLKNTEIPREYIESSFSRLDILAKTDKGELINIEMQRADEKNMIKRTLYYWSKAYSGEYNGHSKYEKLPRTICINVLDFNLLPEEKEYHNVYLLTNSKNRNILTDTMEIHFIELPKMNEINLNDPLTMWTAFLNDPNDEKVINSEISFPEIHEAREELARLSRDPKEIEHYRMRQNAENEKHNALLTARDNAKEEIVRKLFKMNFSLEMIAEATEFSVEKIKLILEEKR